MIAAARLSAALCVVGVLAAGCGDLPDEVPGKGAGRGVSESQIASHPAGTPERALLEWLRYIRSGDAVAARAYYAPSVHTSVTELGDEHLATSPMWKYLGPPRFLETVRRGRRATVYVLMSSENTFPNGRVDARLRPRAFHLAKVGNDWKLTDNLYLRSAAEAVHRTEAEARQ